MGCGDAYLARNLKEMKIYSFDLVKYNENITVSDIKNVPLENGSVDIVVFCLSLMGKNFVEFLSESRRILKSEGILIVCEISSRIVSKNSFLEIFDLLDYKLSKVKDIHNYFQLFIFRKKGNFKR
jgi:ribosomal RNA-processing protein 8